MSQYSTGTISTTAGSPTVIGAGVEWSLVSPDDLIVIGADVVPYTIATVTASTSTITLTANYPTLLSGASYVISRDFTPAYNLPLMNQGDVLTAFLFNEAMKLIDAQLQGGWISEGAFDDAAARTTGVPSPTEGRSYAYTRDDDLVHLYIGGAWEPWAIAGITVGPAGLDGFTPEPDWVDTTKLRFTVQAGGYTTEVELKGEKGDTGGLTFKGGWSAVTTYAPDDIVTDSGAVWVCILANTNYQPAPEWASGTAYIVDDVVVYSGIRYICILGSTGDTPPNATYWTAQGAQRWTLLFEQFAAGEATVVVGTFVDADLDGNDALAIAHGIGNQAAVVKIFNEDWEEIGPDEITATSTTVATVDLSSFAPLTSTWRYIVTGKTP